MIIETFTIDPDLTMTLSDQTSHYFGGYFHVKILAWCDVPLKPGYFENDAEFSHAVRLLGTSVRFERVLEKMAVPASGIDEVRIQLIQHFHKTTGSYLANPGFAPRFARSEYQKRVKNSTLRSLRV